MLRLYLGKYATSMGSFEGSDPIRKQCNPWQ